MTNQPMAVILAAGEGSRMRPLTATRPKVMLPVAGKPMLEHLIIQCREAGVSDFILVVGYREEQVRDHFGDGTKWGIRIRYVSQRRPAGTADALRQASPLLAGPFLLLNGDILMRADDIAPLFRAETTMLSLVELADVSDKGVVELYGEHIVRLHEKSANPPTHLANAGAYYFTPEVFQALEGMQLSPRGEFEITDTIQAMIDAGLPVGFRFVTTWRELGYPWDLLSANEQLMIDLESKNHGVVEAGAVIKGAVVIGKGSIIHSGSYIVGPVIIGQDCDVGPTASSVQPQQSVTAATSAPVSKSRIPSSWAGLLFLTCPMSATASSARIATWAPGLRSPTCGWTTPTSESTAATPAG